MPGPVSRLSLCSATRALCCQEPERSLSDLNSPFATHTGKKWHNFAVWLLHMGNVQLPQSREFSWVPGLFTTVSWVFVPYKDVIPASNPSQAAPTISQTNWAAESSSDLHVGGKYTCPGLGYCQWRCEGSEGKEGLISNLFNKHFLQLYTQ